MSEAGKTTQDELLARVEVVFDEKVRPFLRMHHGDVIIHSVEDGVINAELTGACSTCPAAYISEQEFIEQAIAGDLPEVERVSIVQTVSDELIAQAKEFLARRKMQRERQPATGADQAQDSQA